MHLTFYWKGSKMRIKENKKTNKIDFASLRPGDCFEAFGRLYVKSQAEQRATGLETGDARVCMCGIFVTPVNAEVQIID